MTAQLNPESYPVSIRLAPGVLRLFSTSKSLEIHGKQLCLAKLEELLANGVIEYSDLSREEGVNFNPLPARLLEILHRESQITELTHLHEALILAETTHQTPELGTTKPMSRPKYAEFAWLLDRIRHFKKLQISSDLKQQTLIAAEMCLEQASPEMKESRITTLLKHAASRYTVSSEVSGKLS